jgi:hypothetical protein
VSEGRALTIRAVGQLFGLTLPEPGGKCKCPFRVHRQRKDPTFRVYKARVSGSVLYKCWSCDPPDNVGDSVALYARLAGCDRKEAWKRLKNDGYAVPGAREGGSRGGRGDDRDRSEYAKTAKRAGYGIPPCGSRPKRVLALDVEEWKRWRALDTGALARFAKERQIPVEFLRRYGMIDLPGGEYVGFTYFDPDTRAPCRVKVRGVAEKKFFVLPRPGKSDGEAKALAPLYLAHELKPDTAVVVVEGEIDALTLRYAGIRNVVSLPDGSSSAKTADLSPLVDRFKARLAATDGDKAGDEAFRVLQARDYGQDTVRVRWRKLIETADGDDVVAYKDANDALRDGKFTREDFVTCLRVAEEKGGYVVDWERP